MSRFSPYGFTDVFRGSHARAQGFLTDYQLRSSWFRRLFQDVYVPAHVPVTHELRCRGAALIAPAEAVITGRSAATIQGVDLAGVNDPVEIVVPDECRFGPVRGLHIRRTAVSSEESGKWNGIRIAKPLRTALDLVLRHSPRTQGWIRRLRTAVGDLDSYLRSGLVRRAELRSLVRESRNRGIVLARSALSLADPRAESPPESDVRVLLRSAGYFPKPQLRVWHDGVFLGRLDLGLDEWKVGVEYDGRWHDTDAQSSYDSERRRKMAAAGWQIIVVKAEELAAEPRRILDKVRKACGLVSRPA